MVRDSNVTHKTSTIRRYIFIKELHTYINTEPQTYVILYSYKYRTTDICAYVILYQVKNNTLVN